MLRILGIVLVTYCLASCQTTNDSSAAQSRSDSSGDTFQPVKPDSRKLQDSELLGCLCTLTNEGEWELSSYYFHAKAGYKVSLMRSKTLTECGTKKDQMKSVCGGGEYNDAY